jgi:hypothetical protein
MKSPGLKQAEAERAAKIKEAGKEGEISKGVTAFMETIKDPALLSNFIAEQAPNLLPGLAVARGLSLAGAGARTHSKVLTLVQIRMSSCTKRWWIKVCPRLKLLAARWATLVRRAQALR